MKSYMYVSFNPFVLSCFFSILLRLCRGNADLPIFNHLRCAEIEECLGMTADICIEVKFDSSKDCAALNYNFPQSDKSLGGFLVNGLESVTVTGNWNDSFDQSSEYHISIIPSRSKLSNRYYRHSDGTTSVPTLNNIGPGRRPEALLNDTHTTGMS